MRRKMFSLIAVAAVTMLTLAGCGSNRDSSGSVTGDADDVLATAEVLGISNCVKCHSAATVETDSWLRSAHGNSNARPSLHDESSTCYPCHNQMLEGGSMDQVFPAGIVIGTDRNGVDVLANQNRDMISCESCHGGGEFHSGVGPIPYARPDWEQCIACHDHPEGVRHSGDHGMLASNVGASAHNNADDLHASTTRCQRCHTVEGSIQLAAYTGDSEVMHLMDDLDPIDLEENLHPVTCSACHVPHTDELRADTFIVNDNDLAAANWDPNGNGVADQFDFCTSCHVYYNQDGTLIGSGSVASGTAPFYHNTAWYRILPSTHYDDPDTLSGQGVGFDNPIEGYVIRQNTANPCFDCHGHELRTNTHYSRDEAEEGDNPLDYGSTIHTQWASSAHAGGLLKAKYAAADANPVTVRRGEPGYEEQGMAQVDAVMAAAVIDAPIGNAWAHYDWDTAGREACQHCHTATGAANFLDAAEEGEGYSSDANDFSHLVGGQNEMLYCWGCHSNAQTGAMRTAEPIKLDYLVNGADLYLTATDGSSAACLSCHSGRGNAEGITGSNTVADPTAAAVTNPGTKSHYLAAGLTINQALVNAGYTFGLPAEDYADPSYYAHNTLGCAECHMTSEESHTFKVVDKNDDGVITRVMSTKCVECHDGGHGAALVAEDGPLGTAAAAAALLEEEAEGYHQGLEVLGAALTAAGTPPQASYPYFSGTITNQGHSGAMYNYSYLHHEPGAYAHNRVLAKRLIYDSLDWLDNAAMDASVVIDATAYPHAAAWLGTTRP